MATQREIRRRMGSIRNIRQITRAMELIAVTRLRRAQQRVVASRPYADKMRQVLGDLVERIVPPETEAQIEARAEREARELEHGYTETSRRPIPSWNGAPSRRIGVILLTTDRGLCGALNSNILRTGPAVRLRPPERGPGGGADRRRAQGAAGHRAPPPDADGGVQRPGRLPRPEPHLAHRAGGHGRLHLPPGGRGGAGLPPLHQHHDARAPPSSPCSPSSPRSGRRGTRGCTRRRTTSTSRTPAPSSPRSCPASSRCRSTRRCWS